MASSIAVDLSHHDKHVTSFHEAYEAGIRLFIFKATEGTSFVDPMLFNWARSWALHGDDMPEARFGLYHFGTAAPAVPQVKWFMMIANRFKMLIRKPVKLLALDVEVNPSGKSNSITAPGAEAFHRQFRAMNGNKKPMIYGGAYLREIISHGSPLLDSELWLADYRDEPRTVTGWKTWRLWQYSAPEDQSGPPIPGLGVCDKDKFNGSKDDLLRWYDSIL